MLNQFVVVENKVGVGVGVGGGKRLNFEREANAFDGNGPVILGLQD